MIKKTLILAIKKGMSHRFDDKGSFIPVTVLQIEKCAILQRVVKCDETFVLLGTGRKKLKNVPVQYRALCEPFERGYKYIKGFWISNSDLIANEKEKNFLQWSDLNWNVVDTLAYSRGKGFSGVMKRYNFAGGPASHGASLFHRRPGSIGQEDPGRVLQGQKMPGRHGNYRCIIRNLNVVFFDSSTNEIFVKGSIAGAEGSLVLVSEAKK